MNIRHDGWIYATLSILAVVFSVTFISCTVGVEHADAYTVTVIETCTIREDVETVDNLDVLEGVESITYFDAPIDTDLQDHIFYVCDTYGVDPAVIVAMIDRESDFDISTVGDNGNSFGLMQIQPKWHYERMQELGCTDLMDPYQNITVGVDYLAELIERDRGIEWALMAYNGGPAYANRMTSKGVVSDYAKTVLGDSVKYKEGGAYEQM